MKIIGMVGLPRSGKSTKALELSKIHNAPIVNGDSIRLAIHGQRFLEEAEVLVRPFAIIMARALFHAGHEIVIVDECNVTESVRKQWIYAIPGVSVEWVTIATPIDVCISRADSVLKPVIERMALAYQPVKME